MYFKKMTQACQDVLEEQTLFIFIPEAMIPQCGPIAMFFRLGTPDFNFSLFFSCIS